MKTFTKIIICIIIILLAIGAAYLIHNGENKEVNANTTNSINKNTSTNTSNNTKKDQDTNQINKNEDYIGEEEKKEEPKDEEPNEPTKTEEPKPQELTGKEKAVDIVKNKYAMDGQTVRFDHMEGKDYIIKINEGTAVTWYIVNGTTWEAREY